MKGQFIFVLLVVCCACQTNDYSTLEKRELERGVRNDSLFEGLYLGMSKAEFRARSFQLNQDTIFTDGPSAKIRYKVKLRSTATLLFFPEFADDKIAQVPATVQYDGWAPWNKELSSENLVEDLKQLFMKWYGGNEFLEVKANDKPPLWLKVDGNRRITVVATDDAFVKVMYRDLTVKDGAIK
jgi:hypothetical protein